MTSCWYRDYVVVALVALVTHSLVGFLLSLHLNDKWHSNDWFDFAVANTMKDTHQHCVDRPNHVNHNDHTVHHIRHHIVIHIGLLLAHSLLDHRIPVLVHSTTNRLVNWHECNVAEKRQVQLGLIWSNFNQRFRLKKKLTHTYWSSSAQLAGSSYSGAGE